MFYHLSAILIPLIATAATPAIPNKGLTTEKPTMAPKRPKHIATISNTFRVELPLDDGLGSMYPHERQHSALLEIDLLHSGQSISAIVFIIRLR